MYPRITERSRRLTKAFPPEPAPDARGPRRVPKRKKPTYINQQPECRQASGDSGDAVGCLLRGTEINGPHSSIESVDRISRDSNVSMKDFDWSSIRVKLDDS